MRGFRNSVYFSLLMAIFIIFSTAGTGRSESSPPRSAESNGPAANTALTTVRIASGLSQPVFITHAPGDSSRLFILEQYSGEIKILKNDSISADPFLDLGSSISTGGERGLLGLAFHPDYANNGYFYVNYTNTTGSTVISRFTVSDNPDLAEQSTEQILLTIAQPYSNHNGGMIAFGPDAYLYIGTGDGGSGGDPQNRAQSGGTLLGKILRIDVDGGSPYTVPADNPYVDSSAILDEIWTLGLRNPWRFSFDAAAGDMYIADVGQNNWEEIDFQGAGIGGLNFGWRCYEGTHAYNTADCGPEGSYNHPIHEYNHSSGDCSVTGGYVYRGCAVPDLDGTYFFGDFCTGRIWSFKYIDGNVTEFTDRTAELAPGDGNTINMISSFGVDIRGEIYITDYSDGEIYKIVPADDVSQCSAGCGDIDSNGSLSLLDIVYLINFLYKGGPEPLSSAYVDVNNSGSINILDASYFINFLYRNGPGLICPI